MPTYEYSCDTCGRFDLRQSFTDAPLSVCPTCGGAVRRVFQPVGIVFKGSGWYITDSRNGNSAEGAQKDEKREAGGEGRSESKTEAKSESPSAKTEAAAV